VEDTTRVWQRAQILIRKEVTDSRDDFFFLLDWIPSNFIDVNINYFSTFEKNEDIGGFLLCSYSGVTYGFPYRSMTKILR
jgi:hypothetical protein